ncbi:MAG: restriction endonuclease, partial [Deltaproteobacteria bacterium]|nr:restriction endonuclease [Deltaproteobacteria bacterium]
QFFAQYKANYRSLANSQKKSFAERTLANPELKLKYERTKERHDLTNKYLALKYPYSQGVGDNNLFRFFLEKSLSLLAPGGLLSYILPNALLTEDSSLKLRKLILEKYTLLSVDGFENRQGLFPDVHRGYKFSLIQIENQLAPQQSPLVRFKLTDPLALKTPTDRFPYSLDDLKATSPQRLAFMETAGGAKDLKILKNLYSKYPPFNPLWLEFRRELHSFHDKEIFLETEKPGVLPLYKGEMIWQFAAQVARPKYWLEPSQFDQYLLGPRLARLKSDLKAQFQNDATLQKEFKNGLEWPKILAFLGLKNDDQLKPLIIPERNFPRLAFRAIAGDTDERTLISALVPKNIGAQNSLWLSIAGTYHLSLEGQKIIFQPTPILKLLFVQALFNSLIVDWLLRAMVAINVSKTYVRRLPLPQPSDQELETNPELAHLIRDSLILSLSQSPELRRDLQGFLSVQPTDLLKTPQELAIRQAALDGQVARLYGLTGPEMGAILESFKVLKTKKPFYYELIQENIKNL